MTDSPPDPGIRRPQEALGDPQPEAPDENSTTDPDALAAQVPRSTLWATSSTPTPEVPRVPPGGSDPYGSVTDDPAELAAMITRRRF